jgi:peptide/nickel transport system substrate-binding protein
MSEITHNSIEYCKEVARGFKHVTSFRLSYIRKVFSFMGKTEKIIISTLLAVALLSLLLSLRNFYIAHTKITPAVGGIYTEGMVGQPVYLNPLLARQDIDTTLNNLIYSSLYKYNSNGAIVPDLADGMPSVSQDQKQYTINLKKNIKWHNDKPFTADDVIFTIQTLQDPAFKSPLRPLWLSTTVEKINDTQIRLSTKDISGPFIHHLILPIMPKFIWSRVASQDFLLTNNNLSAVGTGPYTIQETKKLKSGKIQEITFKSFSNYYLGKPKIESIVVKFYDSPDDAANALHSKEIDGLGFTQLDDPSTISQLRQNVGLYSIPLPQYQVVFFNLNNKVLSDTGARQSLAFATDRQAIIADVFKGQAILPNSTPDANLIGIPDGNTPYDQTRAVELLEKTGWKVDPKTNLRTKKNIPFEITILTNDSLQNSKAAEMLASQWSKLNIKVSVTITPTKQLTDNNIKPRAFDVLIFSQKLNADLDPFIFWHSSQTKDPGWNITGFNSPDADRLISQMRSTTDLGTRQGQYANFNTLVAAYTPVIFLNQSIYNYVLDTKVQNAHFSMIFGPEQRFNDVENWYIETKRVWK